MTIKEIAELRAAEFMSDVENFNFTDDHVEAFTIALEEIIDECKYYIRQIDEGECPIQRECD